MNPQPRTILDCLQAQVKTNPDKIVYRYVDKDSQLLENPTDKPPSLTFQQLDKQARSIAELLLQTVSPNERVILLYPPGLEFMQALIACFYAGVIAVPAVLPRNKQHLTQIGSIADDIECRAILSTTGFAEQSQGLFKQDPNFDDVPWVLTDGDIAASSVERKFPALCAEDIAFLQYTSGSTGQPKGVMVSHGNILSNARVIYQGLGHTTDTISICWLPHFHDMGLIGGVLVPLYEGFTSIFMPPTFFLQKPIRWLWAISTFKAESSGGPNFAYQLCIDDIDQQDAQALDLSGWKVAFNGAEPVLASVLKKFAEKFAAVGFDKNAFYPCYGMAETTLMVCGGKTGTFPTLLSIDSHLLQQGKVEDAKPDSSSQTLVSCGVSPENHQFRIVDPKTRKLLPDNRVGEIWVRGGSVAKGYWRQPSLSQQTFHAQVTELGEKPFLRTGDLGFTRNQEIYICGREKELIIIRGRNYYPQDIEACVASRGELLVTNKIAAISCEKNAAEELVIVAEVTSSLQLKKQGSEHLYRDVQGVLSATFELQAHDIVLIKPGRMPLTSSGKKQRRKLQAAYADNALDSITSLLTDRARHATAGAPKKNKQVGASVSSRDSSDAVENLQAWLCERIAFYGEQKLQNIHLDQSFHHLGLDSLKGIKLSGEIGEKLNKEVLPTCFYDYPTIGKLTHFLLNGDSQQGNKFLDVKKLSLADQSNDIAIIGMACRFPGANSVEAYWQLLASGEIAIREWSSARKSLHQVFPLPTAYVDDVDLFDAEHFGISPKEAKVIDPQQRLLLEVSYEAILNAGYSNSRLDASDTGVFIGISQNEYSDLCRRSEQATNPFVAAGNSLSVAANRLSYFYNLKGPSIAIDTACSSSLVALHQAIRALQSGDCGMAMVGGVNLILGENNSAYLHGGGMLADDGRCKVFDDSADGYVRGEGCAVVIVKPLTQALRDQDRVLAVIKASAIEQDGKTNGLHAPNGLSQQAVIRKALYRAQVDAADINYVEAHGTGTRLGDPIEVNALQEIYANRPNRQDKLYLGSVKANIGHLESAAGIASLVKSVLMLEHKQLVPQVALDRVNPLLQQNGIEFPKFLTPMPCSGSNAPKIAISSFGFGGTNAHVILESAPTNLEKQKNPLPSPVFQRQSYWVQRHDQTKPLAKPVTDYTYITEFQLLEQQEPPKIQFADTLVVVGDENSIFDYNVVEGFQHLALDDKHFHIVDLSNLEILLSTLVLDSIETIQVLLLHTLHSDETESCLNQVLTAVHILRAENSLKSRQKNRIQLWMFTHAATQVDDDAISCSRAVAQASLWGFAKTLALEMPELLAGIVDLDCPNQCAAAYNAARGLSENTSASVPELFLRWSNGQLFGQRLRQTKLVLEPKLNSFTGSALISGGLGSLGMQLAHWLAQRGISEIHLCARRENISEEIRSVLSDLRNRGIKVETHAVDMSDVGALANVVRDLKDNGVTINHCFHLAGVLADSLITNITPLQINRVLQAKLQGAINLHQCLSVFPIENFVVFSSSAAIFGNHGQAIYAAANAAVDNLVRWRQKQGLPALSINWGPWSNSNMVDSNLEQAFTERGVTPLTETEALDALEAALNSRLVNLCVHHINWPRFSKFYRNKLVSEFAVEASQPTLPNEKISPPTIDPSVLSDPHHWLLHKLADISEQEWSAITLDKSLIDMGFDSLMSNDLQNAIRLQFGIDLDLIQLLEYETALDIGAELAKELDGGTKSERQNTSVEGRAEVIGRQTIPCLANTKVPLSFAQERLWFLDQYEDHVSTYHMPGLIHFHGRLNINALEFALNNIVTRHQVLRSRFVSEDDGVFQVVDPPPTSVMEYCHLGERDLEPAMAEQLQQTFDLCVGPLFRTVLFERSESNYTLFINMHHTVADGLSVRILLHELTEFYYLFAEGKYRVIPPLPIQYADYAVWQRQTLTDDVIQKKLIFWREELNGVPNLDLPTCYSRPEIQNYHGDTLGFTLDEEVTQSLQNLSRQQDCTLFMTLLTVYGVLLGRYASQTDFAIGTPVGKRNRSEIEPLIGLFVNALALRINLAGDPAFVDLLQRVKRTSLNAFAQHELPFEKIVDGMNLPRHGRHAPLFQVMFVLQDMPDAQWELPGLKVSAEELANHSAKYDLSLTVLERKGMLEARVEYATALFNKEYIKRFIEHFEQLIRAVIANPHQSISKYEYLTVAEKDALLVLSKPVNTAAYPKATILQRFEDQVKRTPRHNALIFLSENVTYTDLNHDANRLAHHLLKLDLEKEELIAVCLERTPKLMVSILAILKTGAAYLPIDSANPPERVQYILQDAGVRWVITDNSNSHQFQSAGVSTLNLDQVNKLLVTLPSTNPNVNVNDDQLAYVIYTSGSTGQPKGVMVEHRQVARLMTACETHFQFKPSDVWTLFHSVAFDFSVWEMWGALFYGGALVIVPYDVSRSPQCFYQLLREKQVTVLNQTPSAFRQIIEVDRQAAAADLSLRYVIFGGEALNPVMLAPWLAVHGDITPQLINMYGITETTVHVTYHRITKTDVDKQRSIIGKPLPDLGVYLLDENQQLVADGIPGEIFIGGAGLARSYWQRQQLTADRFIENPIAVGTRLYRSGDWARRNKDGTLEYLGRRDQQVKIRGFRIELGEIEAQINRSEAVSACVVLPRTTTDNNTQLIAYIVENNNQKTTLDLKLLQEQIKNCLPDYMRPSAFVPVESIPLTANGKTDQAALLGLQVLTQLAAKYVAPVTESEQKLATIFAEVLGREKIGINDNFFDLGGHSLLAINLMAKIGEKFKHQLLLATLFKSPTVKQLAAELEWAANNPQALESSQDILVSIHLNDTVSGPPLFGVPGAGGQVLSFHPLAKRLRTNFYGLQSIGIDGVTPPLTRVETIAQANIEAMKKVQPRGPYRLIGHSFGGLVAFEMATMLVKQGETVEFLLLLDVFATIFSTQDRRNQMLEQVKKDNVGALFDLCELIARFYNKKLRFSTSKLEHLQECERMDFIVDQFISSGVDISRQQFQGFYNVYNANFFAALNYQPRKLERELNVALFYSSELFQLMQESGWDDLLAKEIALYEVAGSHVSMLSEDTVDSLSHKIEKYLRDINAEYPHSIENEDIASRLESA